MAMPHSWYPRRKGSNGFTLLQLAICLGIVAALVAVALPMYTGAIASSRSATVRSAMVESILHASRQAIVSADHVVLCPSRDGSTCIEGSEWSSGWIAFSDRNHDRMRTADEPLVVRQPRLENGMRLFSTQGRKRIVFQPRGHAAGTNVTFTLCPNGRSRHASTLIMGNSGLWRAAEPGPGSAIPCTD